MSMHLVHATIYMYIGYTSKTYTSLKSFMTLKNLLHYAPINVKPQGGGGGLPTEN